MVQIVEINKKVTNTKPRAEVEEMIKKGRKEYERPVKGRFEFTEAPGGVFSFTDRQWPGMPIMQYTIRHDEMCIIPYGVAKRLNNTVQKIRHERSQIGESGAIRGVPDQYDKNSRIKFIPEEYL